MASKLQAVKMNMTQIFRDSEMISVTPLRMKGEVVFATLPLGVLLTVSGISKGKGFAGVVKRHGFGGGPQTHGQKNRQRAPGSIGNTTPQRVLPGRRMAGHMGVVRITVKNLKLIEIKPEEKIIFVRGAVPGNAKGTVEVQISK